MDTGYNYRHLESKELINIKNKKFLEVILKSFECLWFYFCVKVKYLTELVTVATVLPLLFKYSFITFFCIEHYNF